MSKPSTRRRRRRIAASVVCLTIGGTAAGLAWRRQPATTTAEAAPILKTTPVKTGDLTTTERIDGTIELSSTLTVLHRIAGQTGTTTTSASKPAPQQAASASNGASVGATTSASTEVTQTITSVVAVNTDLHSGDVLYTVDGEPVVALDGSLPAWRSLSTSSADGADIAQLEAALVALGYDPKGKVNVDNHFDAATRTMVKAWQQGLGIDQTGKVTLGSIVFLPSTTSVTAVEQHVGDRVGEGDAVLQLASPKQDVVIDVPAGDEALVVPGLSVTIGDVQGTVDQLRSADAGGSVVVEAVIAPATAIDGATNGSTVKVSLTLQNATGVLLVPAEALVSRLDGTYAVQVKATGETANWLAVKVVGASGGNVAVRADGLTEGTLVLLPV
jgi:peptidoglycan hydrolase-like protein with peptidoglycan-binding domain